MVTPFGIFFLVVAAIMVVSTVIQFQRRRITGAWAMFWTAIWIVGSVMMFFTGVLDDIGQLLGGQQGSTVVIYLSIILLFYIAYRTMLSLQDVRKDISRLVEEIAKREKKP